LAVAPDTNPDVEGRPSPVVVRVYQLKEEGAFNNAEYFALVDKEQETLGPSLVSREEYELRPQETRKFELKSPPEAKYLGVIAGFRDIRNAKWKAVAAVPEKDLKDPLRLQEMAVNIGKTEVWIAVTK
jgi:type VI secretion system protein VasD